MYGVCVWCVMCVWYVVCGRVLYVCMCVGWGVVVVGVIESYTDINLSLGNFSTKSILLR